MNSNSFPPKTSEPTTNGHHKTPLAPSGVSLSTPSPTQAPTTFAADLPLRGLGPKLYALTRFEVFALSVVRCILVLLLAITLLAALGILPGHLVTATIALLVCVVLLSLDSYFQRKQYVSFSPVPLPANDETPLATQEKVAIYATGMLSVEGRYRRFSSLPGFYRTFATGEHALLCLVNNRKWLGIFSWPADEIGMWYAFVDPADIHGLTWGLVDFGTTSFPAVAIEYSLHLPPGPRRKREDIQSERLIVATANTSDAKRIYVDLRQNLPNGKILAPLSHLR